jgi:DNA repair protein RecO (recombination protein O)
MQTRLQAFYILHSRPFKETSLLLDCLSEADGRVSLVAKGAKRPKSAWRGLLQPFTPLMGTWMGKRDLKTLTDVEASGSRIDLKSQAMFIGFYVNELLTRLTHHAEPLPIVFSLYDTLFQNPITEAALRRFEFGLLKALGYGLSLTHTTSGEAIEKDQSYQLDVDAGFTAVQETDNQSHFSGDILHAIANNTLEDPNTLKTAKQITRLVLKKHLGDKPLKSREMMRAKASMR